MHSKRKWQEEDDMDDDSSVEDFDDDTDVDVSDDDSDLEEPDLKRSLSTMTWPLHHSTTSVQQAGPNYRYLTRSHKDWTEDRLGREITIKSIWIRGIIATGNQPFAEIGPSNDYTFVRVVLASWNGTAGLTPLTTLGYFFTTLIKPSVTQDLRKKFYDRTFIFQNAQLHATLNGYQKQFKKFRIYRRFRKGYRVKWILPNTATSVKRQITLSCISSVADVTGEPTLQLDNAV